MPARAPDPNAAITRSISGEALSGANYTAEEEEFIRAMQTYMRVTGRRFPSFTEVLSVARALGYRKVEPSIFSPKKHPRSSRGSDE